VSKYVKLVGAKHAYSAQHNIEALTVVKRLPVFSIHVCSNGAINIKRVCVCVCVCV